MTLLIRHLGSTSSWVAAGATLTDLAGDPPLWALREFMPSERDAGGLSVFAVEGEDEALVVAGAIIMARLTIDKGAPIMVASTPLALVTTAGIEVEVTPGELHHTRADQLHRDLKIPDPSTLTLVASAFMRGDIFTFTAKEAAQAARAAIRADQFDCKAIAKIGFEGNARAKNVLKFIGEDYADVKGRAA